MIDRVSEMETGWAPRADDIKELALQYAAAAQERLAEGGERVKEYVAKEPARALGIALGLGVLLGWMIKRR
jgi:ElaB/YqjD/DUF883 family membrane-anchored ribosome-binding protein